MPNLENAKKALRQSIVRRARNEVKEDKVDNLRRKIRKSLEAKDVATAKGLVSTLQKHLGKAVKAGVLKPNTASRLTSRVAAAIKKAA